MHNYHLFSSYTMFNSMFAHFTSQPSQRWPSPWPVCTPVHHESTIRIYSIRNTIHIKQLRKTVACSFSSRRRFRWRRKIKDTGPTEDFILRHIVSGNGYGTDVLVSVALHPTIVCRTQTKIKAKTKEKNLAKYVWRKLIWKCQVLHKTIIMCVQHKRCIKSNWSN